MHTTFNNNSNNNDFIATYINRWTWPMYSVCKLDHATVDPFTVNYTCASHFFTSENALQNKNVPLIASLSLSLFKSCPESGEEHAYAHARTMNYCVILIAARYILFHTSLSLTPYFSRPIGLKKGTANRCLSTGHANICAKKPAGETWEGFRWERETARSKGGQTRQERDDEIRLPAAHLSDNQFLLIYKIYIRSIESSRIESALVRPLLLLFLPFIVQSYFLARRLVHLSRDP